MDNVPDRADVVLPLFRERQCLAHQATNALPQCGIQPLDMISLSAVRADRTMAFRWQNTGIGIPNIAGTDGTLPDGLWLHHVRQSPSQQFLACRGQAPTTPIPSCPWCQQTTTVRHMRWSIGLFLIGYTPRAGRGDSSRRPMPGASFLTPGRPAQCLPARCAPGASGQ
jgi:hypothetical protein